MAKNVANQKTRLLFFCLALLLISSLTQAAITKTFDASTNTITIKVNSVAIGNVTLIKNSTDADQNGKNFYTPNPFFLAETDGNLPARMTFKIRPLLSDWVIPSNLNTDYNWVFNVLNPENGGLEKYEFWFGTNVSWVEPLTQTQCHPYYEGSNATQNEKYYVNCSAVLVRNNNRWRINWTQTNFTGLTLKKDNDYFLQVRGLPKNTFLNANPIDVIPTFAGAQLSEFAWWNTSFTRCVNLTLVDSNATEFTRTNELHAPVNVTGLTGSNLTKELRLVNAGCGMSGNEVPYWIVLKDDVNPANGSKWAAITFLPNKTAGVATNWSVYSDAHDAAYPDYQRVMMFAETFNVTSLNTNYWNVSQSSGTWIIDYSDGVAFGKTLTQTDNSAGNKRMPMAVNLSIDGVCVDTVMSIHSGANPFAGVESFHQGNTTHYFGGYRITVSDRHSVWKDDAGSPSANNLSSVISVDERFQVINNYYTGNTFQFWSYMPMGPSTVGFNNTAYTSGWIALWSYASNMSSEYVAVQRCGAASPNPNILSYNKYVPELVIGQGAEQNQGGGANVAPNVTLNAPNSGNITNVNPIVFQYTPTDDNGFSNCSIWSNFSGTWASNNSNASAITNNSVNSITVSGIPSGYYVWNVNCTDNATTPLSNVSGGNYTLTVDKNAPTFTFVSQFPADLNTYNELGKVLNVTYSASDVRGVNDSSVIFWHAVNLTRRPNGAWQFINGTAHDAFWSSEVRAQGNVSNYWYYNQSDHEVYPSTNNLDPEVFQNLSHVAINLANGNDFVKTRLYNVTNLTTYGVLEFMANATSATVNPLRIYYCNSSYTTGAISTSAFCAQIATLLSSTPYNHTHTVNQSHALVPFNMVLGTIAGVKVTNDSYFALRGATGAGSWNVWAVSNVTRPDQIRTSNNNGISWSNYSGTVDLHVHQFSGSDNYTEMIQSCDWLGNCANSSVRLDQLDLGGLPPRPPSIYQPNGTQLYYNGTISVNWTAAISPNGYSIANYNVSVYYSANGTLRSFLGQNTTVLDIQFNTATVEDGNYSIRVYANDSNGLTVFGLSDMIVIDNTVPIFSNITPPTNYFTNDNTPTFTWNVTDAYFNQSGIILNGDVYYDSCDASVTTTHNCSHTNGTMADGTYLYYFWANDTVNNMNWTATFNITIDTAAPFSMNMTSPVNNSNSTLNYSLFNFTVYDAINVTNCSLEWSNGTNTTMTLTAINATAGYCVYNQSVSSTGIYDFKAWVFDAASNYNSTSWRWTFVNGTGFSVSALYPIDGQSGANPLLFGAIPVQQIVGFANCSVIWDSSIINTTFNPANNTLFEYTATSLAVGAHVWSIECWDTAGNSVSSGTRGFTVQALPPFGLGGGSGGAATPTPTITPSASVAPAATLNAADNLLASYTEFTHSAIQVGENTYPAWMLLSIVMIILALATIRETRQNYQSNYELTGWSVFFIILALITIIIGATK